MNSQLEQLEYEISRLKEYLAKEEGKRDKLKEQLKENEVLLAETQEQIELLDKVTLVFQKTSEFARKQAKRQIETIVTKCLQYIFETNIEFEIEINELRNKANAEFYVINETDGLTIKTKPELSRGGGIVDIVSLALRIAFLQIHKPPIEGPLILDEPAKHVSEDYIYNVGEFLKQTSEMFNRQIIMVTHNQHLSAIGNIAYRVQLIGSESECSPIEA
ncbi:ATPase [Tissierella sp. Yu-01]|uniref:ATPase n=1 Tax=Tissierella sp. Yu-01 TaxID=3035694 RepID=UPI00240E717E|nr:ATPase [Tissierella sp. Yu-01]WFA09742.1 ATPase [Tissierella sp. Yu-01]